MLSSDDIPQGSLIIELPGVYDGWSIIQTPENTLINRWANADGTGPEPGYERRYEATERAIDEMDGIHPEYQR